MPIDLRPSWSVETLLPKFKWSYIPRASSSLPTRKILIKNILQRTRKDVFHNLQRLFLGLVLALQQIQAIKEAEASFFSSKSKRMTLASGQDPFPQPDLALNHRQHSAVFKHSQAMVLMRCPSISTPRK